MMPVVMAMAPRYDEMEVHGVCVGSMAKAGFDHVHVIAEPGRYHAYLPDAWTHEMHLRRLGEWQNFIYCLRWIIEHSDSDRFMFCQDDVIWCRDAAELLEIEHWPSERCGCLHAYTSKKYAGCYPVNRISRLLQVHARCMAAACGLVFRRDAAELLVQHADDVGWRGHTRDTIEDPERKEGVDTYVGEVLTDAGYEIWIHNPSLGQHISKSSTLGHGGPFGSRVAANWSGIETSAFTLFPMERTACES